MLTPGKRRQLRYRKAGAQPIIISGNRVLYFSWECPVSGYGAQSSRLPEVIEPIIAQFRAATNYLSSPLFGQATQMLASALGAGDSGLYQIGGPRSATSGAEAHIAKTETGGNRYRRARSRLGSGSSATGTVARYAVRGDGDDPSSVENPATGGMISSNRT